MCFSARYGLLSNFSFNANHTKMSQYVHSVSNSGVNLSTDIWYPTDIIALPQRSNQFAAGLSWSITKDILVTNEVYYKWINRIVNSRDGVRLMMMIKVEKSFLEMEQVMVMNSIKKKMENLLDG